MPDERFHGDNRSANQFTGEVGADGEMPSMVTASFNLPEKENGLAGYTGTEWIIRAFELSLVVLVAFGQSILRDVYPFFVEAGFPASQMGYYSISGGLHVTISLALTAYVVRRTVGPFQECRQRTRTRAFFVKWFGRLRQVRTYEVLLVIGVAFCGAFFSRASSWLTEMNLHGEIAGVVIGNLSYVHKLVDNGIDLGVLVYVLHRRGYTLSYIGLRWSSAGVALALPVFLLGRLIMTVADPSFYQ